MASRIDKEKLLSQLINKFNGYYDDDLIRIVFNENIEDALLSYNADQDINLDIDLYVTAKIEQKVYMNIIEKIKKEEDLLSEIYLIEKFRYVHNMYTRKHYKEKNDRYYEAAIEELVEEYDGSSTISSFLYKIIVAIYEKNDKNLKIKVLSDK